MPTTRLLSHVRVRLSSLTLTMGILLGLVGILRSAEALGQTRASFKLAAEEPAHSILVLDYSNSMWGQIRGVAKIDIARSIIERNLSDWNKSTPLGLVAYGHRRKGDCNDIELIASPDVQATNKVLTFLAEATPRGRTPLAGALQHAAEHGAAGGGAANIILLTDGIESCGRDPCAAVKALQTEGAGPRVHVVGLDLDLPEANELRCIAEITGGRFLAAKDALDLDNALADALAPSPGVVVPAPRANPATSDAPVPTADDTVRALISEGADLRNQIAGLQNQMIEQDDAQQDQLDELRVLLNRSRLTSDRLRTENDELKAAIRAVLELLDQAVSVAGDVLAPASATSAARVVEEETTGDDTRRERSPAGTAPMIAVAEPVVTLAPAPEGTADPVAGDVVQVSLADASSAALDDLLWTVTGPGEVDSVPFLVSGSGSTFLLPRADAAYQVLLEAWPHRQVATIEVRASERKVHRINLNLAVVALQDAGDRINPVTLLFTRERGVVFETDMVKSETIYLPEGRYEVAFLQGLKSKTRKLELIAGTETTLAVPPL